MLAALSVRSLAEPAGKQVLIGQDGWFVYVNQLDNNLNDYLNLGGRDQAQLAEIRGLIAQAAEATKRHGAELLWVIPPNTPTVYPESMPRYFKKLAKQSRLEQLTGFIGPNGNPHFLDLTAAMLAAKPLARLYQKTDTHWNDYGAWIGYREILRSLASLRPELDPALTPWEIDRFNIMKATRSGGDLAQMLGLQGQYLEEGINFVPKNPRQAVVVEQHEGFIRTELKNNPSAPRLLMYRDSFAGILTPFISEHFSVAIFLLTSDAGAAFDIIQKEKIDYVVIESVERKQQIGIQILKQLAAASADQAPATSR